jgi:poly [ADP-ribose] polymerase
MGPPSTRRSTRVAAAGATLAAASKADEEDGKPAAAAKAPDAKIKKTQNKRDKKASSASAPRKKKRTGLKSAIMDTHSSLGVIDPESNIKGTILDLLSHPCDVMLCLVDPAKHMDKFFILQLIEKDNEDVWVVYTRWGRSGTAGQALEQEFEDITSAIKCFTDKFKEKTALEWEDREAPTVGGKYRFIAQDFVQKQGGFSGAKWQYWVDDGVNGKVTGWYDYDDVASHQVERLYLEHTYNPHFSCRSIASGSFTYDVDLAKMIQTNVTHSNHTSRRVRRCPNNGIVEPTTPVRSVSGVVSAVLKPSAVPSAVVSTPSAGVSLPSAVVSMSSAVASMLSVVASTPSAVPSAAVASTPVPSTVASMPVVTPNPVALFAAASGVAGKKAGGSHPVDQDIAIKGKNASDYQVVQSSDDHGQWYDTILNQCNIAGNNNKYYRLQMLQDTGCVFYVWFRWGRVGERATGGASTWSGPFPSEQGAKSQFVKKYRDKTGNVFGADSFVEKKGKYVTIEVDNDVDVKEEFQASAGPAVKDEIEYLPSALEPNTKELVEVLFSKEMRNEALTSFNLDLKRLPLGVPSKQQIQHGVTILSDIEDKLNGGTSSDTFEELSSRFYTAIPHSFGRTRPPIIASAESLQSRYGMCNILLDMYSTTETISRIEQENKAATKKIVPDPIDQHYLSLQADLLPVEANSEENKLIRQCFDHTKGRGSNAQLLNVWSVDRKGEAKRFKKYDKLDNRRLLWHGTNIAVAAPIITSGLRIMPHSGGRVGSGIYLAALQEKSAQYTSSYGSKFACMFLCEAPLGKQHVVDKDGPHASGLKTSPDGFDSVHAVGAMQPKTWAPMKIDEKDVSIPQSQPEKSGIQSHFTHDEFLVYDESQVRLRYVVTVKLY